MLDILYDNNSVIQDKIIDHLRWSVVHELVFKYDGNLYRTQYSVGATEGQAESPWDYEDIIECEEVKLVEKLVRVYESV